MAASGYILGGVVWFAVPMMMGSTHGLVGRALAGDLSLVNGASHITEADSGSGLTPARVAVEVLGGPGAWILLIMLFMAIVSTGCAEIIAVATIMTYDVYCEYLNPELKGTRMKNRQVFYATLLGKSTEGAVEGKDILTVASEEEKKELESNHEAAIQKMVEEAAEQQKLSEARFEEERTQMESNHEQAKKDHEAAMQDAAERQKLLEAGFAEERKEIESNNEAAMQKVWEQVFEKQKLLEERFEEEKTQMELSHEQTKKELQDAEEAKLVELQGAMKELKAEQAAERETALKKVELA